MPRRHAPTTLYQELIAHKFLTVVHHSRIRPPHSNPHDRFLARPKKKKILLRLILLTSANRKSYKQGRDADTYTYTSLPTHPRTRTTHTLREMAAPAAKSAPSGAKVPQKKVKVIDRTASPAPSASAAEKDGGDDQENAYIRELQK